MVEARAGGRWRRAVVGLEAGQPVVAARAVAVPLRTAPSSVAG
jgi:hypothetical protein